MANGRVRRLKASAEGMAGREKRPALPPTPVEIGPGSGLAIDGAPVAWHGRAIIFCVE